MGLSREALAALRQYPWPGNVRELKNEIQHAAIMAKSSIIDVTDLSQSIVGESASTGPAEAEGSLAERFAALARMEQWLVEEACRLARGNQSMAARLLGISRIMIRRRIARFKRKLRRRSD